jgi:hypothetical protein
MNTLKDILVAYQNGERGLPTYAELAAIANCAQPINDTIASQLDNVTVAKICALINQGMKPVGVVMLADDGNRATVDMGKVTWTGHNQEPTIDGYPLWSGLPPPAMSDAGNVTQPLIAEVARDDLDGVAHEVWAAAQLVPGEGITDGVSRIVAILSRRDDADLLDALETGLECAREVAADIHLKWAGYKPHKHAAVDADVAKIEKAIAAIKLDDVAGDAPSQSDIAQKLRALSDSMSDIAVEMDYFGGMAEWAKHSVELLGASAVVGNWALEIDAKIKKDAP